MNEWLPVTLKDLVHRITKGTTPSTMGGAFITEGINFIKSEAVNYDGKIDRTTFTFIDKHTHNKLKRSQLQQDDILFSMAGVYLGKTGYVTQDILPANTNQALAIIRVDAKKALPKFVHFILQQKSVIEYVNNISGQSAQPNINMEEIGTIEINLPPLPEQEAIAEVLSSLDDKIDLLHRNNKALQAFAEMIFQKYFKEADWTISTLDEVAIVQNGCSFKSNEFVSSTFGTYEVFKMGHIDAKGGLRSAPKKDYIPKTERLIRWVLKKRDIVLAMTDMKDNVVILGVPALIDRSDHYVLNQRVARIYLKENSSLLDPLLLYFQMRDRNFIATLQSQANSGVQVNLTTDSIKNSEIVVPPAEMQREILSYLRPTQDKIEFNRTQIHQLENIRNTLLPKLMSGAVRVNM